MLAQRHAMPSDLRVRAVFLGPLLLGLVALALVVRWASLPAVGAGPPADLHVTSSAGANLDQLVPLDPLTLADRQDHPTIALGSPSWLLSGDGSTLVEEQLGPFTADVRLGSEITFVVRDARTGSERNRFHPPAEVYPLALNRQGTRLVVEKRFNTADTARRWYVLDPATGQTLATVNADAPSLTQPTVDPSGRRLYVLVTPGFGFADQRAEPVRLLAYDLTTGQEAGMLALPNVLAGAWNTGRVVQSEPVRAGLWPVLAVSPDGRRLAMVHGDGAAVTLIDAERLTVEREVSLHQSSSVLAGLDWLAFIPRIAYAKVPAQGVNWTAAFAPSGRELYLSGESAVVHDDGTATYQSQGLKLVDLDSGRIRADARTAERATSMIPSPDGRSLYVFGARSSGTSPGVAPTYILDRLDATTLATEAERRFADYRRFVVTPGTAS